GRATSRPVLFRVFQFRVFVISLASFYRFVFFVLVLVFAFTFAFALAGLWGLSGFSGVGGGGVGCGIACMRRCISSIDTSSMCVPTVHLWPKGSIRVPERSP